MLAITFAPGDAAMAARLRQELEKAGEQIEAELPQERGGLLLAVLSPEAETNSTVQDTLIRALDQGNHILLVLARPILLPKLIDHLPVLDFTEQYDPDALLQSVAALTSPQAGLPLRVQTPRVRRYNRRSGLILAVLALLWFTIGVILVGVYGAQAPIEEYSTIATEAAATVYAEVRSNLPRSTADALNFSATVQAVTTAQRPLLVGTATAIAGSR
jgi:hypothetical protein